MSRISKEEQANPKTGIYMQEGNMQFVALAFDEHNTARELGRCSSHIDNKYIEIWKKLIWEQQFL